MVIHYQKERKRTARAVLKDTASHKVSRLVRTEQEDPEFKKKPTLALELIDKSLNRGYQPGIVLIDSSYGNNTSFLKDLEEKKLKYIGGIAKNRNILIKDSSGKTEAIRIDEYARWISSEEFKEIQIPGEKPRTVWVAILSAEISLLLGQRKIAIVMNAPFFEEAEDIDERPCGGFLR